MREVRHAVAFLDVCDQCGGIWFDSSELQSFLEHRLSVVTRKFPLDNALPVVPKRDQEECPHCQQMTLAKSTLGGMYLLRCVSCSGVFLAKDEVERLLELKRASAGERATEMAVDAYVTLFICDVLGLS